MKPKEMTLILIGVYLLAVILNFEGIFWGDVPRNRIQIMATICYAAVSVCYLFSTRKHRGCILFSAFGGGGLLLAGGLAVLTRSCWEILSIPAALFVTIFITPLYGARAVLQDWDMLYAAMAAMGGAWLAVSLLIFRGNEKYSAKREEMP